MRNELVTHIFKKILSMKNIYIFSIIFFLLGCKTSKQNTTANKSKEELQKEYFEIGNKFLKRKKLEEAFQAFHHSFLYNQKSEISKICITKIDSILPIIKKKLLQQWQGKWKLKELNFEPFPNSFPDFIEFHNNEVIFYKEISSTQKKIIRKEIVKFVEYDSISLYLENYNLKFNNSEIWGFNLIKKNKLLKLYPTIVKDSTGIGMMLHQSSMTNKKRKEEEKKEKYTFYTKVK